MDRPDIYKGYTRKLKTRCGNIYITLNDDQNGNLVEVLTTLGKGGSCPAAQGEAVSRMVSLSLRYGAPTEEIQQQLRNISCNNVIHYHGHKVQGCADAIAITLKLHMDRLAMLKKEKEEAEKQAKLGEQQETPESDEDTSDEDEVPATMPVVPTPVEQQSATL
jgi:ribonucleoside-diphosphate reductase alpha chain